MNVLLLLASITLCLSCLKDFWDTNWVWQNKNGINLILFLFSTIPLTINIIIFVKSDKNLKKVFLYNFLKTFLFDYFDDYVAKKISLNHWFWCNFSTGSCNPCYNFLVYGKDISSDYVEGDSPFKINLKTLLSDVCGSITLDNKALLSCLKSSNFEGLYEFGANIPRTNRRKALFLECDEIHKLICLIKNLKWFCLNDDLNCCKIKIAHVDNKFALFLDDKILTGVELTIMNKCFSFDIRFAKDDDLCHDGNYSSENFEEFLGFFDCDILEKIVPREYFLNFNLCLFSLNLEGLDREISFIRNGSILNKINLGEYNVKKLLMINFCLKHMVNNKNSGIVDFELDNRKLRKNTIIKHSMSIQRILEIDPELNIYSIISTKTYFEDEDIKSFLDSVQKDVYSNLIGHKNFQILCDIFSYFNVCDEELLNEMIHLKNGRNLQKPRTMQNYQFKKLLNSVSYFFSLIKFGTISSVDFRASIPRKIVELIRNHELSPNSFIKPNLAQVFEDLKVETNSKGKGKVKNSNASYCNSFKKVKSVVVKENPVEYSKCQKNLNKCEPYKEALLKIKENSKNLRNKTDELSREVIAGKNKIEDKSNCNQSIYAQIWQKKVFFMVHNREKLLKNAQEKQIKRRSNMANDEATSSSSLNSINRLKAKMVEIDFQSVCKKSFPKLVAKFRKLDSSLKSEKVLFNNMYKILNKIEKENPDSNCEVFKSTNYIKFCESVESSLKKKHEKNLIEKNRLLELEKLNNEIRLKKERLIRESEEEALRKAKMKQEEEEKLLKFEERKKSILEETKKTKKLVHFKLIEFDLHVYTSRLFKDHENELKLIKTLMTRDKYYPEFLSASTLQNIKNYLGLFERKYNGAKEKDVKRFFDYISKFKKSK